MKNFNPKRLTDLRSEINDNKKRIDEIYALIDKEKRKRTPEEATEWQNLIDANKELEAELRDLQAYHDEQARNARPVGRDNSEPEQRDQRVFEIRNKVADEPNRPISSFILRNYDVSEASQKADPFKVIMALGGARFKDNGVTERAMNEVRAISGGTNVIDTYLSSRVLENMLAKSHLANAGMTIATMESQTHLFGRISGFPTFQWLSEGATQSDQTVTFDAVSLSSKTLRSWCRVSNEFIQDLINGPEALQRAFSQAGATEIDRAGLEGTGTGGQPTGIAAMANVSQFSMGTNGASLTNYDPFLDAQAAIYGNNGPTSNTAIMHPTRWAVLNKLKEATTNAPLARPAFLQNWNFLESSKLLTNRTQGTSTDASNIYIGNFQYLTLGVRLNLEIRFVNEDAPTNSRDILAVFRGDYASEYQPALGRIIGVRP